MLQGQTLFQPLAHLNYFIIISIPTHKRRVYTQQQLLSLVGYESLELIIWGLALFGFAAFACPAKGSPSQKLFSWEDCSVIFARCFFKRCGVLSPPNPLRSRLLFLAFSSTAHILVSIPTISTNYCGNSPLCCLGLARWA